MLEIIVCVLVGLLMGAVMGMLISKSQKSTLVANLENIKNQKNEMENSFLKRLTDAEASYEKKCQEIKDQMKDTNRELLDLKDAECKKSISVLTARYEQEIAGLKNAAEKDKENWEAEKQSIESKNRKVMEEQDKRHNAAVENLNSSFHSTVNQLKDQMKSTTEDILKTRQKEFSDFNKDNIKGILEPLNLTISNLKSSMESYSQNQSKFEGTLSANLETIIQKTETTCKSAEELTNALKHDTKVQGDYGEAILDEIMSKQGFTKGIHYDLQYSMKDDANKALKGEDGTGMRPDMIVHLDTERDVIVDSKVNLTAFINYVNAETAEERKHYLEIHVKSIENQVKLLSQKKYAQYHKKTSGRMDFVLMFVPISAAWNLALSHKPSLWREAIENNVYIVDEQNIFAALKVIKLTWTKIAQVKNQDEIFKLVDELIDRIGQFRTHYAEIGSALDKVQTLYVKCKGKLDDGRQSVLASTKKLIDKGGQDSKKHPISQFLDVDDIQQLPDPVKTEDEEIVEIDSAAA